MIEPESNAQDRAARRTSWSVGGVLLLVAAWSLHRHRVWTADIAGSLGALLLLTGVFVPAGARLFHRGWMKFATALGYVNSRILLSVLFFGVLTPFGWASRLFRRDPLTRRSPSSPSYWVPRKVAQQPPAGFERSY